MWQRASRGSCRAKQPNKPQQRKRREHYLNERLPTVPVPVVAVLVVEHDTKREMSHMMSHQDMDGLPQNPSIHPELDNMDPNGHPGMAQMGPPPPHHPPSRKRKKMNADGQEATPAQPRRLRRSHEACARCRSKKIKVSGQRAVGFSRRCRPGAPVRFKLAAIAFWLYFFVFTVFCSVFSLLMEN